MKPRLRLGLALILTKLIPLGAGDGNRVAGGHRDTGWYRSGHLLASGALRAESTKGEKDSGQGIVSGSGARCTCRGAGASVELREFRTGECSVRRSVPLEVRGVPQRCCSPLHLSLCSLPSSRSSADGDRRALGEF
ncbi:hypothetical protein NDU88_002998 [Pleurodeles waltl]|uniref:Secreted protein n=1 Tax=Pleurodeles waltl TaxID=8319 RepID=A0AAV7T3I3_PLEWA|nr:hypothetical protein NDU88_002998 [Pleurodeles waltl]